MIATTHQAWIVAVKLDGTWNVVYFTIVWVGRTPNAGQNMFFSHVWHEKYKKGTKSRKMRQNNAKNMLFGQTHLESFGIPELFYII